MKPQIRKNQLIEQGILSRLKAEWIRSGSVLSFNEWLVIGNIVVNSKEIEPEFKKTIKENFWDLV